MGQSVSRQAAHRGLICPNSPTSAPELVNYPMLNSSRVWSRSTLDRRLLTSEGVDAEMIDATCSTGHSARVLVLNAHATRGTCPTSIEDLCGCPVESPLV